jgi:hypothetical protein
MRSSEQRLALGLVPSSTLDLAGCVAELEGVKKLCARSIAITICFSPLTASVHSAGATRESLISPPLYILNDWRLAFTAPSGWSVASREPAHNLTYFSYEFSLASPRKTSLVDRAIEAEIFRDLIIRDLRRA